MSPPYDNSQSRRRGGLGHWVPLAITVTIATVGLAAWILNQRVDDSESDEEDSDTASEPDLDYYQADYGENPAYGASSPRAPANTQAAHSRHAVEGASGSWTGRVQGALRRTSSPQHFLDSAGKTVVAGIAATGAAISNTLAAIREEDKNAFADHETWSEEADSKKWPSSDSRDAPNKRKTVAIVVSADSTLVNLDNGEFVEHASILSHIPKNIDHGSIRFFVLIYAPGLKEHSSLEPSASNHPPPSLDSSFSKIEPPDMTPGSEKSPLLMASSSSNAAFNAVQSQALALVEKHTMVLPFTSSNGHVHILRHLQPDVIYLQESLSGENGSVVNNIQTWMKNDICLVVGVEGGHGALADSDSEAEKMDVGTQKLWQLQDWVGRGRGVVVVDGMRVHDDWMRRVEGRD